MQRLAELPPEEVTEELTETDEEEKKKKTEEIEVPSCTFCLSVSFWRPFFNILERFKADFVDVRQWDGPQLRRLSMKSMSEAGWARGQQGHLHVLRWQWQAEGREASRRGRRSTRQGPPSGFQSPFGSRRSATGARRPDNWHKKPSSMPCGPQVLRLKPLVMSYEVTGGTEIG